MPCFMLVVVVIVGTIHYVDKLCVVGDVMHVMLPVLCVLNDCVCV